MLKAQANDPKVPKGVLSTGKLRSFEYRLQRYAAIYDEWITDIKKGYEKEIDDLKAEVEKLRNAQPLPAGGAKDKLKATIEQMLITLTPEKLEALLENGAAMRVIAQIAGIDLSDKPQEVAGPGADIIIIRPHPGTEEKPALTPAQEADVTRQIAALIESHKERGTNDFNETGNS